MAGDMDVVQRTFGFEAASLAWVVAAGDALEPMDAMAGCSVSSWVVFEGAAGASSRLSTHAVEQRGKPLRKRGAVPFPLQTTPENLRCEVLRRS